MPGTAGSYVWALQLSLHSATVKAYVKYAQNTADDSGGRGTGLASCGGTCPAGLTEGNRAIV